jgi:hypothetical protein
MEQLLFDFGEVFRQRGNLFGEFRRAQVNLLESHRQLQVGQHS